jgi:hypothetical protein
MTEETSLDIQMSRRISFNANIVTVDETIKLFKDLKDRMNLSVYFDIGSSPLGYINIGFNKHKPLPTLIGYDQIRISDMITEENLKDLDMLICAFEEELTKFTELKRYYNIIHKKEGP